MQARTALILFAAGYVAVAPAGAPRAQQQPPPPAVVVAPAELADLSDSVGFTGRVVAAQKVDIYARVTGFLEEIAFEEGAEVASGDVLYRIQDDAYRAGVAEIRGSIAAVEAKKRLAEIERDRKAELVNREAVAQVELDTAQAQLGQVEGELAQLNGTLARAELELSYTELMAPFDGIVGLSIPDIGALVGPESGPLTTLTRLDPIEVEFSVASALVLDYRRQVAAGEISEVGSAALILPNGAPYDLAGDIDFVSTSVAEGTDTVRIRAEFANPDGMLLDGALVQVTLQQSAPEEVLVVPQQAVQRDQAGAFVMVVGDDSTVELRRIEIARTSQGLAVIADGLEPGESVIVEGVNKVRPGVTVDAAPAQAG